MGDEDNHEINIDWAFGDYRLFDYFGVRAGEFKFPSTMYNDVRDVDVGRVPILLPQSIYDESTRQITLALNGIGFYGNLPLSSAGDLDYEAFGGDVNIASTKSLLFRNLFYEVGTGIAKGMAMDPTVSTASYDDYSQETATLRKGIGIKLNWNTPLSGLRGGASYVFTEFNEKFMAHFTQVRPTADPQNPDFRSISMPIAGEFGMTINTFFMEYSWNNLTLAGEYYKRSTDITMDINSSVSESENKIEAYYGLASY